MPMPLHMLAPLRVCCTRSGPATTRGVGGACAALAAQQLLQLRRISTHELRERAAAAQARTHAQQTRSQSIMLYSASAVRRH